MKTRTIITALLFAAALLVAAAPASAKHKHSKSHHGHAKSYYSIASYGDHSKSYYYHNAGSFGLRDRAAKYFGSPVHGKEFFEDIGSRGGQ